jgi:hypothetical protein
MLVAAAGLALALALTIAVLRVGGSAGSGFVGGGAFLWAIPLTVGAVVGLSAWMLLDGTTPTATGSPYAESICPSCGRAVLEDWRLCPHCGAFITAEGDDTPELRDPR